MTIATLLLLTVVGAGSASEATPPQSRPTGSSSIGPQEFLESLVGRWTGTCRTWFRPGELADESNVVGEFQRIVDGRFLRHSYEGSMRGASRKGEETIVFNPARQKFQVTWIDEFHMNYGILFSQGERTERGFSVRGTYAVSPDTPVWGWRTDYELSSDGTLTITAYNVFPEGKEVKAVETVYRRADR